MVGTRRSFLVCTSVYLTTRLAGRTGQADRTGRLPYKSNDQLTTKGNEKESPLSGLQKLHLTEVEISIRDAVLLPFEGYVFSVG